MRALVLVALLLLAPTVQACSLVADDGFFLALSWPAQDRIITSQGYAMGEYDVTNASFTPVIAASVVAPDASLRWWAYAVGDGLHPPAPGSLVVHNTCGDPYYGETGVWDATNGTRTQLLPGGATALAAGPRYLAVAHRERDGILLYEWGRWGAPARTVRVPEGVFHDPIRLLGFDPTGRWLVAAAEPRFVAVVDLAQGAPQVVPVQVDADTPVQQMAFSPDGARVAFSTNARSDAFGEVHVLRLGATEIASGVAQKGAIVALAWGAPGLAALVREQPPYTSERNGTLMLFPDAENLSRVSAIPLGSGEAQTLAWSPQGDKLGVGENGKLRVFDAALREQAPMRIEAKVGGPAFQPPREVGASRAAPAPGALLAVAALLTASWRWGRGRGRT